MVADGDGGGYIDPCDAKDPPRSLAFNNTGWWTVSNPDLGSI